MTLQRMLRQRYGPSISHRAVRFARRLVAKQMPRSAAIVASLRSMTMDDRWAAGHFCYGVHELLPRPSIYLTMLRQPIDRLISLYYFVRSRPDAFYHRLAKNVTIEQFLLEEELLELDNGQLRVIVGGGGDYFTNRTPRGQCTMEMLELAKRRIEESFCLAGVTERFDESVLMLGRALGWQNSFYLRRNEGPRGGEKKVTHPALAAELKRRNQLDCALYDWVVERLNKQIHAEGETFGRAQERFIRRNRTYNQLAAPVYDMYDFCKSKAKRVFHYRGYHHAK